MSDPRCFTCEDQGFLICGSCDTFEELVVVRREDLAWALKCKDFGREEYEDIELRVEAMARLKAAWEGRGE